MSIDLSARDARIGQLENIVAENMPGHVTGLDYQDAAISADQRFPTHPSQSNQDFLVRF
jgi:hypothetical protein